MRGGADDRGLTLIELVVVMALFALIAVMGLQGLQGSIRLGERLSGMDEDTARLGLSADLLRNDLSAAVPMLFFPPGGGQPRSALRLEQDAGGAVLALSVGGQAGLSGDLRMHRVEWRFDRAGATLSRRVWPLLTPASATALSPERVFLDDVTALRVESFWDQFGWMPGVSGPALSAPAPVAGDSDTIGPAPEVYSDRLPRAVAVVITTRSHGEIRLVEGLQ
ncbi:type II secretion system protein GspJ [Shimia biformata]|uniref:type II secretion system protein GspJ n=1 Tax=Shimia biformata TaxID=1294299 RepID=UPI0019502D99|nr:type II secretion system protein GspJ [Shimia biformata]